MNALLRPGIALVLLVLAPGVALAAGQGDLYVQSLPTGASIWLDGQDTGQVTPFLLRGVSAGEHEVRLRTGCQTARAQVQVTASTVARADLTLSPGEGAVRVVTSPAGAQVQVDGVVWGTSPLTLSGVQCGPRRLTFHLEDHHDATRTLQVEPWAELDLEVPLKAIAYGTLVVVPDPVDSQVLVDGRLVGTGAMTLERLTTGTHEVVLERDGHPTQRRVVSIPQDQVLRLEVSLVGTATPVLAPPVAPAPPARDQAAITRRNRHLLAAAAAGVGAGFAAHGAITGVRAGSAWDTYMGMTTQAEAEAWYDAEVAPRRTVMVIDLATAAAFFGAGSLLWVRASSVEVAP